MAEAARDEAAAHASDFIEVAIHCQTCSFLETPFDERQDKHLVKTAKFDRNQMVLKKLVVLQ